MTNKTQKTILLGVTGGIAAYKMCELARQLIRAGHNVKVVMTKAACEFVGPATFRSLTGNPVATELFDDPQAPINHINLAEEADIFLIAPATANVIAKLAQGRADDLLTTTALAFQGQLLIAPAMNTKMYLDPATQANLTTLAERGVQQIGPAKGELACGDSGEGRMVEVGALFDAVEEYVHTSKQFKGKKVLISAGPTREYLDPVRYLSNRSSGKMGIALVREALRAGAEVTLVLGPVTTNVSVPADKRLTRIDVVSAQGMYGAMMQQAADADVIICAAAVADHRPKTISETKIKKSAAGETSTLDLVKNPDILAELGRMKKAGTLKPKVTLVGFAAETDNLEANAQAKLEQKGADYIIANDISRTDIGFESDQNEMQVFNAISPGMGMLLPKASKTQLARQILHIVC